MLYRIRIEGISPIIQHSASGLDDLQPINQEIKAITSSRGSRTEAEDARLRQLETIASLWLDANEQPTIPAAAIRSNIEKAARKRREGPQVREGLVVTSTAFEYDNERYGDTLEELQKSAQFTVPVVVQRNRIMRTRAKFDLPWACVFEIDADDELVSESLLTEWLDIGGRRIGLGDWRPEKSGQYGRFELAEISAE